MHRIWPPLPPPPPPRHLCATCLINWSNPSVLAARKSAHATVTPTANRTCSNECRPAALLFSAGEAFWGGSDAPSPAGGSSPLCLLFPDLLLLDPSGAVWCRQARMGAPEAQPLTFVWNGWSCGPTDPRLGAHRHVSVSTVLVQGGGGGGG